MRMNLTEFLLARIAEDEAATFELIPYGCAPGCCAPAGWVGHHCKICDTTEYGGTVDATMEAAEAHEREMHARPRVLAECEAKRRIVEEHPSTDRINHEGDRYCRRCLERGYDSGYPDEWVQAFYPCPTLRLLALPYAEHPDYNEAWRA